MDYIQKFQQRMRSLVAISVRMQMQLCEYFHFEVFWIFKALGVRILTMMKRLQTKMTHQKNTFPCLPFDLLPLFKVAKAFHRVAAIVSSFPSCSVKFW